MNEGMLMKKMVIGLLEAMIKESANQSNVVSAEYLRWR